MNLSVPYNIETSGPYHIETNPLDWVLYGRDLRHERVKSSVLKKIVQRIIVVRKKEECQNE